MAVSVTLQSAFVGAVVLLSIISIERLPMVALPTPMPPLPKAPRVVELVATEITRHAVSTVTALTTFTEPMRIPRRIAMIVDEPIGNAVAAGSTDGIPNTGYSTDMYGRYSDVITRTVLPSAPPAPKASAETAVAPPPKMITVGGVVLAGKLVKRVMPEYPVLARQARIEGVVKLMGIVGQDGLVRELNVVSGHPLLVPAALAAVRQWVYSPTLLNGSPVDVKAPIEVTFTLAR